MTEDIKSLSDEVLKKRERELRAKIDALKAERAPVREALDRAQARYRLSGSVPDKQKVTSLQLRLKRYNDDMRSLHHQHNPIYEAVWERRREAEQSFTEVMKAERKAELESAFVQVAKLRLSQTEFDRIMQDAAVMCSRTGR